MFIKIKIVYVRVFIALSWADVYNWTSLISIVNIRLSCCSNQNTVGQFAVPHTQKHAHVPFNLYFVSACQMEGSEGVETS